MREHAIDVEATNREPEAFTRSASHDLRTPPNAILDSRRCCCLRPTRRSRPSTANGCSRSTGHDRAPATWPGELIGGPTSLWSTSLPADVAAASFQMAIVPELERRQQLARFIPAANLEA